MHVHREHSGYKAPEEGFGLWTAVPGCHANLLPIPNITTMTDIAELDNYPLLTPICLEVDDFIKRFRIDGVAWVQVLSEISRQTRGQRPIDDTLQIDQQARGPYRWRYWIGWFVPSISQWRWWLLSVFAPVAQYLYCHISPRLADEQTVERLRIISIVL